MIFCAPGSNCFEWIKAGGPIVVTVIFGAVATVVTVRQYLLARAKLKLDLFDRRIKIFKRTRAIMAKLPNNPNADNSYGLGTPFGSFISDARFLFGKDIENYLKTAAVNWSDFWAISVRAQGNGGIVMPGDIQKRSDLLKWFANEYVSHAMEVFAPYLDFEQWK